MKRQKTVLMHAMADRLGVSVEQAQSSGRLSLDHVAAMVTQCEACTHHDDCILWLLENSGGAEQPPAYCLNIQSLDVARAP